MRHSDALLAPLSATWEEGGKAFETFEQHADLKTRERERERERERALLWGSEVTAAWLVVTTVTLSVGHRHRDADTVNISPRREAGHTCLCLPLT